MSRSWLPDWSERERDAETRGRGDTEAGGRGDRESLPLPLGEGQGEGLSQHSGSSTQHPQLTPESVTEALKGVYDPELAISIVDLGLIYGVDINDKKVHVRMTLTSMGCPIGPMLQNMVRVAVKSSFPQVEEVEAELVWSPPWDPYKMASEEAKDLLGIW